MKLKQIVLPNNGNGISVLTKTGTSVEFNRRLDAYATAYGVVLDGQGYRSIESQAQAWLDYTNDPANHNLAAYPGQSWHNCGLAKDIKKGADGRYPASMEEDYLLPPLQQNMARWGICIPMWKDGNNGKEPWHVVPIECLTGDESQRQKFLDEDDLLDTPSGYRTLKVIRIDGWPENKPLYMIGSDVYRVQRALNVAVQDKYYGKDTESAVKNMQTVNNLTVDGICGTKSWEVINGILNVPTTPPLDYKALYEEQLIINENLSAENEQLKATVADLTDKNTTLGLLLVKAQNTISDQSTQITNLTNKNNELLADINAIGGAYDAMDNGENIIVMAENTVANILDKYN